MTTPRSFATFLAEVEDGRLHHDLSEGLVELVTALVDQARTAGGKPRATLQINMAFKIDRDVVEVAGDFKLTKPKAERGRSIFWTTSDNRLSRLNPRQQQLPFRDVAIDKDQEVI